MQYQISTDSVQSQYWLSIKLVLIQNELNMGSVSSHYWFSIKSLLMQYQVSPDSVSSQYWFGIKSASCPISLQFFSTSNHNNSNSTYLVNFIPPKFTYIWIIYKYPHKARYCPQTLLLTSKRRHSITALYSPDRTRHQQRNQLASFSQREQSFPLTRQTSNNIGDSVSRQFREVRRGSRYQNATCLPVRLETNQAPLGVEWTIALGNKLWPRRNQLKSGERSHAEAGIPRSRWIFSRKEGRKT